MSKIKYVKFRKYAGLRIKGEIPYNPSPSLEESHLERAFYLTSHVESGGKFGAVMNYDGTGMTAGLHQAIAVYPKTLYQGPLWKLMRRVELLPGDIPPRTRIWEMLSEEGMYLAQDGVVRELQRGWPMPGESLRRALSGPMGVVSEARDERYRAEAFIIAFHELFSSPSTFRLQVEYGKEHFVTAAHRVRLTIGGRRMFIQHAVYGDDDISLVTKNELGPELDLAMCMYWSNSVNAPSKAKRCLGRVLSNLGYRPVVSHIFARDLILALGNTTYGRWDDDLKNGRYQRTRRVAMRSGLWPAELFEGTGAIMPEDLPG